MMLPEFISGIAAGVWGRMHFRAIEGRPDPVMYGFTPSVLLRLLALTGCGLVLMGVSGGCASSSTKPERVAEPPAGSRMASEIQVIGDWNDVEASLYAVLGKEELAILNADKGIAEQKFEMLRVTDETAWLIARRNPADGDNMIPIRLTAWVGYFGNVE